MPQYILQRMFYGGGVRYRGNGKFPVEIPVELVAELPMDAEPFEGEYVTPDTTPQAGTFADLHPVAKTPAFSKPDPEKEALNKRTDEKKVAKAAEAAQIKADAKAVAALHAKAEAKTVETAETEKPKRGQSRTEPKD